MTLFVIIIISVNFQLKQLSAKFKPLTISYSCCSIPISSLATPVSKEMATLLTCMYVTGHAYIVAWLFNGIVSKILKFADDTKLCHSSRNPEEVLELQEDLNRLVDWANT